MAKLFGVLSTFALSFLLQPAYITSDLFLLPIPPDAANVSTIFTPCALTCTATVPNQGCVGVDIIFKSHFIATPCYGEPVLLWQYGDGSTGVGTTTAHAYGYPGSYHWSLTVLLDDLTCVKSNIIVIHHDSGMPGDCYCDGLVSIGEVQKAINMFLSLTYLSCGVDCNSDNDVSIGEVQNVINGFLGTDTTPCGGI